MLGRRVQEEIDRICIDGPLAGRVLQAKPDDNRPVWVAPAPPPAPGTTVLEGTAVDFYTYRSPDFFRLPLWVRQRALGCYVERPKYPRQLIWLAKPKGGYARG